MKRALPLLVAGILAAVISFADTSFLGNILQLHSQAEPLPTATNYTGSLVYNTTQSKVYWSNGTTWAELGGAAAGTSPWVDAGTGGIFVAPQAQVRVGTQITSTYGGYTPTSQGVFNDAPLYVYSDGGTSAVTVYVNRTATISTDGREARPNNAAWLGPNMSLISSRGANAINYAQLALGTRGADTTAAQLSAITEFSGGGFSAGSYVDGINISTGSGRGFGVITNGDYASGTPTFSLTSAGNATFGTLVTAGRVNVLGTGLAYGVNVIGSPGFGVRFDTNNVGLDIGTGTYDVFYSDGIRVRLGSSPAGGGLDVYNLRLVGHGDPTQAASTATIGSGGLQFRSGDGTLFKTTTNVNYAPILSGADWVYDGRTWDIETPYEATACPTIRHNIGQSTSGTDVSVSCNDAAAATSSTGLGHPAQPYRNFNTAAAGGSRSIFISAASAPASGAVGTPQSFAPRQAGPVLHFKMRTGSTGITSNITWYAGLFSTIPSSGSPAGNSVYIRFDTNNPLPSSVPDTVFRLCACSGGTCTCGSFASGPAASTEYTFVIDCRTASNTCYGYINGAYGTAVAANLPALSTGLGFAFAIENVDATARTIGMGRTSLRLE